MIRKATTEDIDLLAGLIRDSFRDVAERFSLTIENCPTHPSNCTAEWVKSAMDKGVRFYILKSNHTVCGCVAIEQAKPGVCYLERLAVLPQFRRRGFGNTLVHYAIEQVKSLGAQRIGIAIIAEQAELKNWYVRRGFQVERQCVTFEHLPFKVTFMSLSVTTT